MDVENSKSYGSIFLRQKQNIIHNEGYVNF
jgi:hypothetical protein